MWQPSKANWQGTLAPNDPVQSSQDLPAPWSLKNFTVTPKATYHIKAVVLSKHSYWAGDIQDSLSKYDLALGWGPMSQATVINKLNISQYGRWYNYRWKDAPPIDVNDIISHSANTHIIPANEQIKHLIANIRRHALVELRGYLVDIDDKSRNWFWHTSLSRTDSEGGACELMWVTDVKTLSNVPNI